MATTRDKSLPAVVDLQQPPDDPSLEPLKASCPAYVDLMRRSAVAASEGFSDVNSLDVFRMCDIPDNAGRQVFMFIPAHLPDDADLERVTLYAFSLLHPIVITQKQDFTVMWLCNNGDNSSRLTLRWFWKTFWATPQEYQAQMQNFLVIHPSTMVRARLLALSYLTSSFWDKLDYMDRLEFLDMHVPIALIKTVPQSVKDWDKEQDMEMYHGANMGYGGAAGMVGMGGFGGMGMGAGMMPGMMGGVGGSAGMGLGGLDGLDGSGEAEEGSKKPPELPKRNWED